MLFCIFIPFPLQSEPQIKQFFPSQPVLLGHALYWTIQIQSPVWESYRLQVNSCRGAEIQIVERRSTLEKEEILQTYRIQIVPTDLTVAEAPSVIVSDEKGQSLVLNGSPLNVIAISGPSLEIKDPGELAPVKNTIIRSRILYGTLLIFLGFLIASMLKRYYAARPKQVLLRDLRKAALELQGQRLPVQVWRLLRSDLLWGFSAETLTPSQLREKARWNLRLLDIADGLQTLETWRYAGEGASWEKGPVEKSLRAAIEIAGGK